MKAIACEPLTEIDWYAAVHLSSFQLKLCLTSVSQRSILIHAPQCHTCEFVALLGVSSDAGRDALTAFAFVEVSNRRKTGRRIA